MKPLKRIALPSGNLLQVVDFGSKNTIASIKGSTKKLGEKYQNALVVLYSKINLEPIGIRKPNANGDYQFLGLNNSLSCFIVGFDNQAQFNAVIQDNVVPK